MLMMQLLLRILLMMYGYVDGAVVAWDLADDVWLR